MSRPSSTAHIVELSQIIAKSVEDLERVCEKNSLNFPGLDDPYTPESDAFRENAEAFDAANTIAAAAYQLVAAVMPAPAALYSLIVAGTYKSACVRVCVEASVAELLREAGPAGLHVDEIGAKCNLSPAKLGRIIRFLATHHVFKEVTPNVFANTRLSSVLDTGKSFAEILANPGAKHDNTSGFPALISHHTDEPAKGATYLWETLSDPLTANSVAATDTPFNRAHNSSLSLWEFIEREGEEYRYRRCGNAMLGVGTLLPEDNISDAYDWKSLAQDAVVVDVGGGTGSASLGLVEKYAHLQVVNQDRPAVIDAARALWSSKVQGALESGRAKLQGIDFFIEQPVKNASVFILKQVLHDWSDPYSIMILTELRKAAQPYTKLVIIDTIVPFACPFPITEKGSEIPGAIPREAKAPLLANYGVASGIPYFWDMTMMVLVHAQERTLRDLSELLNKTGWRLTKVRPRERNSFLQPIEAIPV